MPATLAEGIGRAAAAADVIRSSAGIRCEKGALSQEDPVYSKQDG